jgi:hypothetical protein
MLPNLADGHLCCMPTDVRNLCYMPNHVKNLCITHTCQRTPLQSSTALQHGAQLGKKPSYSFQTNIQSNQWVDHSQTQQQRATASYHNTDMLDSFSAAVASMWYIWKGIDHIHTHTQQHDLNPPVWVKTTAQQVCSIKRHCDIY